MKRALLMVMGCAAVIAAAALSPVAAHAYDSDAALERDGVLCTHQITRSERKYGIPQRLLGAIAATESGRRHKGLGIQVPWPWVINAEGRPFFFHSKREAVIAVEKLQAQGVTSIDIGCMQVNLRHHPHAFANLSQAFEPSFNVDYAARFLRGHYDDTGSWRDAVGRYHSRTPGYAARYIGAVYSQWTGLATKATQTRRSKYASYIRMENTGEQSSLASRDRHVVTAAKTSNDGHVVKSSQRAARGGIREISIIRPESSAGKVESAPTVDMAADTGPMVIHREKGGKDFTTPKLASMSAKGQGEAGDSRFIRFAE